MELVKSSVVFMHDAFEFYEDFLGTKAHLNEVPSYGWEMSETQANTQELTNSIGLKKWRSKESIFREFIMWYKSGAS
jgi:hypothetical protein